MGSFDPEIEMLRLSHRPSTHESGEPKSAQRLRYDAEVETIKKRFGSLDQMRTTLGLSRRRMCEYLLVDPSAWTRWTASGNGESAPHHVYKTMCLLMEKFAIDKDLFKVNGAPDAQVVSHLKSDIEMRVHDILTNYSSDVEDRVQTHFEKFKSTVQGGAELSLGWKILIILNLGAIMYFILT